jgi:two-component system sensor histidine kinase PilS (NtrC family)
MTARVTLGMVLMLLQGSIFFLAPPQSGTPLLICSAYFTAALAVRLMTRPGQLGTSFDVQWLRTVGVDVVTFAALQALQNSTIDYAPLFALPVLMASILGSMLLAMGAAASITLLLFAHAAWLSLHASGDFNTYFPQAALTGAGCFAISFIASQLSRRLASVELRAQRSQLAADVQRQVNELVIESLADGILVVDQRGQVRSANPAAHLLLGTQSQPSGTELNLGMRPGWQALLAVISTSFEKQSTQQSDVNIHHIGFGTRRLRVHTQLTTPQENAALGLCVVFMQDQREVQARIRAEKLASMGRMSAAVAHEIRNPLAAISQANALLAEDLSDPGQRRLAAMVQQNALRLENIVQEVLHLAHAPAPNDMESALLLDLPQATARICRDWKNQNRVTHELLVDLPFTIPWVWFDTEHLRRILINLLDNAYRYASRQTHCIQINADVSEEAASQSAVSLRVWSDGAPLEPSVEQHLFEPFFSSESRSSGLGLYICRELCDSHGASMAYDRSERPVNDQTVLGNEFTVMFKTQPINNPANFGERPD